jgi:hypothetical protein
VSLNTQPAGDAVGLSENRQDDSSMMLYIELIADAGHGNKTHRMVSRRAPTVIEKLVSGKPRRK